MRFITEWQINHPRTLYKQTPPPIPLLNKTKQTKALPKPNQETLLTTLWNAQSTLAVAICPSWSIRSIVPVGKYGMMKWKDLARYLLSNMIADVVCLSVT